MDSSFTNAYPHSWESPAVQWLTPCPVNASGHSPRFSVHGQNISTKQNSFQNYSLGPDASWSGRQNKSCLMNMEQGKGRRECWGAPGIHQALRVALQGSAHQNCKYPWIRRAGGHSWGEMDTLERQILCESDLLSQSSF